MSRSSERPSTSKSRSRERMVTLPPIRDIFREHLGSSSVSAYHSSGISLHQSYPAESGYGASRGGSYSPDIRHRQASLGNATPQRAPVPPLRSSFSHGTASPEAPLSRPAPEHRHSHGSPLLRPPSVPTTASASSRSSAVWTEHRRRDSAESVWSTHSSSSAASSQPRSVPPSSNALQFQPLQRFQGASSSSRAPNYTGTQNPPPIDYQSPFGVLIADVDARGASTSDPQRTAIMRTLRATGVQGSFQINFDDPSNMQNPPRYSCQYCGKGFARPSSLRIHINSHTGEKPFQCPHPNCGRRFSVHSNMRRHYRVHGGDTSKNGDASGDEGTEE